MNKEPDKPNLKIPPIESLLTSEIRYRRLFESALDGILILDFETRKITDVNPFLIEFLGYERETLLGKELWEIGLLKDEAASIEAFELLQKDLYIRYEDLPLETASGERREVEFISNVYAENDKKVIQCNIRDIGERKNLERNTAKLSAIVESSHDAIISKNFDGTILSWNQAAENIFGFTAKEMIGQNIGILIPLERQNEEKEIIQKVKLDEHIQNFETTRLKKDGSQIWVSLIHSPIKNINGEIIGISKIAHDISERKRSQAALKSSESRFKQLIESSIIGIIISNLNGIVIEANDVFLKMVGYDRDDLKAEKVRWDEMTPPELNWLNERALKELKDFGASKPHEKEYIRKDGSRVPVIVGGTLLKGSKDTILAFVVDITERKIAEEGMRLSQTEQQRLLKNQSAILDTLPAHICLLDSQGVVLTVNAGWKNFAKKNNYGNDNLGIGTNYIDICENAVGEYFEGAKDIANGMRSILAGTSNHFEYEYPCNSKVEERWFRLMVAPLRGETIEGLVVMHIDTTAHKIIEETLRKTEENYRHLVEFSPGIVYLNQPFPPFSTVYVSPNIKEFGYSPEEWYATPNLWLNIIEKEDLERVQSEFEKAIKEEIETDLKYRIRAKDGSIHWWQDKGRFVYDSTGNKTGWQGIILDITATKGLEHQLRQAQKLESVGLLAGGIAHDFNNMLTAINGYTELMFRQLKEDDPLCYYLEEIKKAGHRSEALTNQLLAFSRRQVLNPVVINLNEIIVDTFKMLQRLIGEDIELTTSLNPRVGSVKVDPGQFSQIILNLAVNARDAMPQGGKLTIETDDIFLDEVYARNHLGVISGEYVMLAVSDTGSGMNFETKQHIFEPFFTTKEVGKGTGLGLATVYGIVKQSEGNIEVYSEVGVGTTFKVYFPMVEELVKDSVKIDNHREMSVGTETILLVEDEALVRNMTSEVLQDCGYTVITASNGMEALEILETGKNKFDLLMTDVVMPQMGGRELAEKLKEKLPNLQILFTSGYTDDAVIRHGVIEAQTNFIQKPFNLEALTNKIREILDSNNQQ